MIEMPDRSITVAEDIEYFRAWWERPDTVSHVEIRHGTSALRRLLIDGAVGNTWRNAGFLREPQLQGPDLLAFLHSRSITRGLVGNAVAGGVRYHGIDYAFLEVHRIDNPATGASAASDSGFWVQQGTVARDTRNATPSELDKFVERTWYLHPYLEAPGLIRRGEVLSRREVIQHMANVMAGVHIEDGTSKKRRGPEYSFLIEAERSMFIKALGNTIWGPYIENLAIGQALGRSEDLGKLAAEIRRTAA